MIDFSLTSAENTKNQPFTFNDYNFRIKHEN